ncbi:ribosome maturation factor RimM [Aquabacterium sp. J223]|uniref:ribosome maturation factor RimM n=1 Tax=Aquabacterium sp. J223 TaxID=2898431 RepID=UPI0021AD5EC7|nr:ribosome maturation factor RimM [Aquabacterium sp. J223]UUX97667.1 ribosome maturation factor RimM [Aquabacterium sp. J223]
MAAAPERRPAALPQAGPAVASRPDDAVEVGRIAGAWGVRGALKVAPHADQPQALLTAGHWFLLPPEDRPAPPPGAVASTPLPPVLDIVQARRHGENVVATASQVRDRTAAEALKGARVLVSRATFPAPDDGEFYWVDLIGLDVVNRDGAALGRVAGLLDTGPHAVLRVQPSEQDADERLIPFVAAYVDAVDLPGRRITVDWSPDY